MDTYQQVYTVFKGKWLECNYGVVTGFHCFLVQFGVRGVGDVVEG